MTEKKPAILLLQDDPGTRSDWIKLLANMSTPESAHRYAILAGEGVSSVRDLLKKCRDENFSPVILVTDDHMPKKGQGSSLISNFHAGLYYDDHPHTTRLTAILITGGFVYYPGAWTLMPYARNAIISMIESVTEIQLQHPDWDVPRKMEQAMLNQNFPLKWLQNHQKLTEYIGDYRKAINGYHPENDSEYMEIAALSVGESAQEPNRKREDRLTDTHGGVLAQAEGHISDDQENLRALKVRAEERARTPRN